MEWQATLYIMFVDFEKAFDSVHQESLWKIMESYGIPCKIIHMVQMLCEDCECAVLDEVRNLNGSSSKLELNKEM